jgi:hypothetical protein
MATGVRAARRRAARRLNVLLFIVSALLGSTSVSPPSARAIDPAEAEPPAEASLDGLAEAAAERAVYGLESDPMVVADIVSSGRDVGTSRWGMVLTEEEERNLDLAGRMDFVSAAANGLVAMAEGLSSYAGSYVVPAEHGRLVVLVTTADASVHEQLLAQEPRDSRGVEVRVVPHSLVVLEDAALAAWGEWPRTEFTSWLKVTNWPPQPGMHWRWSTYSGCR